MCRGIVWACSHDWLRISFSIIPAIKSKGQSLFVWPSVPSAGVVTPTLRRKTNQISFSSRWSELFIGADSGSDLCGWVEFIPGAVSEVRGGVPSGGALSPTTLGSWGIDGGDGNDGCLEMDSCRSFLGTKERNTWLDGFPKNRFINYLCTQMRYRTQAKMPSACDVATKMMESIQKHTSLSLCGINKWEIYSQTGYKIGKMEKSSSCQIWAILVDFLVFGGIFPVPYSYT